MFSAQNKTNRSMNPRPISAAFLFLCCLITLSSCSSHQADVEGDVSINCGTTGASAARNGRKWVGDVRPKLFPLLQLRGLSTASTAIRHLISADPVPHKTARISQSQFSYAFQLGPGQKIIRLHFNPTPYRNFKGLRDLFTVEAGPFTLLSNFSASLTANALGVNTLVKEFCLNVQENQQLIITFSPETSQSQDRYAFINGIEIISVPPSLSYFGGGDIELRVVGQNSKVIDDDSSALEIVHRLNIKEDLVPPTGDFDGVFPTWATQRADKLKNKTWKMPVEVGFKYLIRLHFSEAGLKIAGAGGLMFKILINEMIAYTNTDQIVHGEDQDSTILFNYIVVMRGCKQNGRRRDISISLQSFVELADGFTVLAGFEIVKLSNPDDSLASPNPLPPASHDSRSHKFRNFLSVLGYQNVSGTVAVAVISLLSIIIHKLREFSESRATEDEHKPSANAERHCRRFSLSEVHLATRNFDGGLIIGRGGFGQVYKGFIDDGRRTVAIKRLRFDSTQGAREFMTEIETLSELRHMNLVSLIGYCSERREMILVYEYMACGTLADHLYKIGTDCSSLEWKQRLNICIGAARGLDYLHTGHGIIHRDVKASNILLDENFMAKVSDFGLARSEDRSNLQSHVITQVKGTPGYLDPYYLKTGKLTRRSDIYAFGVVLLVVLCGRRALDLGVLEEERFLSCWARDKISKGEVDEIVASVLRDKISQNSLKTFVEVAERCLHDEPKNRPTMFQIVLQLEYALEQEERKEQFPDVANDVYPANEGMLSSENGMLPEETFIEVQAVTSPVVGARPSYTSAGKGDGKKPKLQSPSRFWPRTGAFFNWIKPSKNKEIETFVSEVRGLNIKLREFGLSSIVTATNQFSTSHMIYKESDFSVYKGVLSTGQKVAIRRYSLSLSLQLEDELKNEINLRSNLNHRNIMNLLGYCIHEEEVILVFDHASQGNLSNHLHNAGSSPLTWKQRLQICIDAAKGLDYLHTGCNQPFILRGVKPTNILLDEKWEAKLSDFSRSRAGPAGESDTWVTTQLKGFIGYMDPDYIMTNQLTYKSDVYSFGVVLYEVLCARRPYIKDSSPQLVTRAQLCFKEGTLEEIIDPNLRGQISPVCLTSFGGTANACLSEASTDRPSMREVARTLEYAMQCQLAAEERHLQQLAEEERQLQRWLHLSHHEETVTPSKNKEIATLLSEVRGSHIKLREFDLSSIAIATNQFSPSQIIYRTGVFTVYKGVLSTGQSVTIKMYSISLSSRDELRNEIRLSSNLNHRNIMNMLGYCVHEDGEAILYSDHASQGNLFNHLHNAASSPLTWKQRLQICIDVAKGLDYLHTGFNHPIIHRDVTSSNILLDEKCVAKLFDFSCSRAGPAGETDPCVLTMVKDTTGYLEPEYFKTSQLTDKSDVYSFGVVLFEILCELQLFMKSKSLATWASISFKEGIFDEIIDANIRGQIDPECLTAFSETAKACLSRKTTDRSAMREVVRTLEFAMQCQLAAEDTQLQELAAGDGDSDNSMINTYTPAA